MKLFKTAYRLVGDMLTRKRQMKYLMAASRMLKEAADEADRKHGYYGWRYYVIWDEAQGKLISLTYENHTHRTDSYWYLRQRGRFLDPLSQADFKELCFYYTPSRWKPGCDEGSRTKKMLEWQRYYVKKMVRRELNRRKSEIHHEKADIKG
jgi:hypothetical protein